MTMLYAGVAGTVGMQHSGNMVGVFRQEVGSTKWQKLGGGLPEDADVHAIAVHPTENNIVYVGSSKGIYRSANRGEKFEHCPMVGPDPDVWSLLFDPTNPRRIYAGASPVSVYRSDD